MAYSFICKFMAFLASWRFRGERTVLTGIQPGAEKEPPSFLSKR